LRSEWREVKLKDVCALKYGKDHRLLKEGSIPVYGSGGIMRYVNDYLYDKISVLIPRKGTLDNLFIVKEPFWTIDTLFWTKIDEEIIDPRFLYFSLLIRNLAGKNVGTAVPSLTIKVLNEVDLLMPPLPTQKAIADTLSCLDAKIEVNNKIIKNLEKQAQAIFKSWFVDFEPFLDGKFIESELGLIPEGWEVRSLDEIARYINGLAMQRYRPKKNESSLPVVKIKELRQRFADIDSDRCSVNIDSDFIIDDGDVVFSWSGSLLVDIWAGGKAGLNQHLFKVTSKSYSKWFYYYWTKFHLKQFQNIAQSRATTMGHIRRGHLKEAKVLEPNKIQLNKISLVMDTILNSKIILRIENTTIAALRDTLLPKLMSGEIEVPVE